MQTRRPPQEPSVAEMLGEIVNLSAGFFIAALPFLLTAVPGLALFVLLPTLLLAAIALPIAVAGALLAGPFVLVRAVRRRVPRRAR
jgi:hypothetical protein